MEPRTTTPSRTSTWLRRRTGFNTDLRFSGTASLVPSRMYNYLDFQKSPFADLEGKIIELKKLAENDQAVDVAEEIARLEKRSR